MPQHQKTHLLPDGFEILVCRELVNVGCRCALMSSEQGVRSVRKSLDNDWMKKLTSAPHRPQLRDWDVDSSQDRAGTFFYPSGYTPMGIDDHSPAPRRAAYLLLAAAFVAGFGVVAFFALNQIFPG
jgi:hypothetical protein